MMKFLSFLINLEYWTKKKTITADGCAIFRTKANANVTALFVIAESQKRIEL